MSAPDRTAGLRAARAKDSQDKRRRALAALHALETAGTPITAAAVAQAAGVSTWLLYTHGIREHLDAARHRQTQTSHASPSAPPNEQTAATAVSLRTEHDKLRQRLRLRLGAEIDGPDRAELLTRLADLESQVQRLLAERDARTTETNHAQRRIHELEDDLSAARESLRRVIKEHNTS